ncbi:N-acetylneuraminate synthase [Legionella sp. W05-934-2]|uniref:N-acetylneuraminate synthase n=1 Tax=Legionella sp. W05-934-2 TaxID=1198649 RepID=UPI003461B33C
MKRTYIIAEAGVNHNGSMELAKSLIDVALEAGADAIKFQLFKAKALATLSSKKASYQIEATKNSESQFEMLQKLELDVDQQLLLKSYATQKGIEFLSTPFDIASLESLAKKFNISRLKISSGDLTNAPLLLAAARTALPLILSTGMASLSEIEQALGVIAYGLIAKCSEKPSMSHFHLSYQSEEGSKALKERVTLLHCTTEYPAPLNEVNLNVMETLRRCFDLEVGYSDHTAGIHIPIAAVAMGATMIEKHFTLDRNMDGPDHKASLEPNELKEMVKNIRDVEMAKGSSIKKPTQSELKNKGIARRSIIATKKITKGEIFTPENLDVKRPESGLSPILYWDLLGKVADKNFEEDEVITALC